MRANLCHALTVVADFGVHKLFPMHLQMICEMLQRFRPNGTIGRSPLAYPKGAVSSADRLVGIARITAGNQRPDPTSRRINTLNHTIRLSAETTRNEMSVPLHRRTV